MWRHFPTPPVPCRCFCLSAPFVTHIPRLNKRQARFIPRGKPKAKKKRENTDTTTTYRLKAIIKRNPQNPKPKTQNTH